MSASSIGNVVKTEITKITLGVANCYLIKARGLIMIDCGSKPNPAGFLKQLKKRSISPNNIDLIVITHGHWDHIAGAAEIKKIAEAKTAINYREKSWLESGNPPLSPPVNLWGQFFGGMLKLMVPFVTYSGITADIEMTDEGLSLEDYGINGSVLHTPGHTEGSMSILLETGEAFVGDLAMNGPPMRIGPGKPLFATSDTQTCESWKRLLDLGARTIYPSHGNPFPASELEKRLS